MKELMLVCVGSFFGGGLRYLVSKWASQYIGVEFPWGTLAVNVAGCFLIGLFSGMALTGHLSPSAKLMLATGFCGGLTTFSTFMNENLLMGRSDQIALAVGYTVVSFALGLTALVGGYQLAK